MSRLAQLRKRRKLLQLNWLALAPLALASLDARAFSIVDSYLDGQQASASAQDQAVYKKLNQALANGPSTGEIDGSNLDFEKNVVRSKDAADKNFDRYLQQMNANEGVFFSFPTNVDSWMARNGGPKLYTPSYGDQQFRKLFRGYGGTPWDPKAVIGKKDKLEKLLQEIAKNGDPDSQAMAKRLLDKLHGVRDENFSPDQLSDASVEAQAQALIRHLSSSGSAYAGSFESAYTELHDTVVASLGGSSSTGGVNNFIGEAAIYGGPGSRGSSETQKLIYDGDILRVAREDLIPESTVAQMSAEEGFGPRPSAINSSSSQQETGADRSPASTVVNVPSGVPNSVPAVVEAPAATTGTDSSTAPTADSGTSSSPSGKSLHSARKISSIDSDHEADSSANNQSTPQQDLPAVVNQTPPQQAQPNSTAQRYYNPETGENFEVKPGDTAAQKLAESLGMIPDTRSQAGSSSGASHSDPGDKSLSISGRGLAGTAPQTLASPSHASAVKPRLRFNPADASVSENSCKKSFDDRFSRMNNTIDFNSATKAFSSGIQQHAQNFKNVPIDSGGSCDENSVVPAGTPAKWVGFYKSYYGQSPWRQMCCLNPGYCKQWREQTASVVASGILAARLIKASPKCAECRAGTYPKTPTNEQACSDEAQSQSCSQFEKDFAHLSPVDLARVASVNNLIDAMPTPRIRKTGLIPTISNPGGASDDSKVGLRVAGRSFMNLFSGSKPNAAPQCDDVLIEGWTLINKFNQSAIDSSKQMQELSKFEKRLETLNVDKLCRERELFVNDTSKYPWFKTDANWNFHDRDPHGKKITSFGQIQALGEKIKDKFDVVLDSYLAGPRASAEERKAGEKDFRGTLTRNLLQCSGPKQWGDYVLQMEQYLRPLMNLCAGYSSDCTKPGTAGCAAAPVKMGSIPLHSIGSNLYKAALPPTVSPLIGNDDSLDFKADCPRIYKHYSFYAGVISRSQDLYNKYSKPRPTRTIAEKPADPLTHQKK